MLSVFNNLLKNSKSTPQTNIAGGSSFSGLLSHTHFIAMNVKEVKVISSQVTVIPVLSGFVYTALSSPSFSEIDISGYVDVIEMVDMIHLIDREGVSYIFYQHEFESYTVSNEEIIVYEKNNKETIIKIK